MKSWFQKVVKNKITTTGSKGVPDSMWTICKKCGVTNFNKTLKSNLYVCPTCNHHDFMKTKNRIAMIFDKDACTEINLKHEVKSDPLNFKGKDKYIDKLKSYRKKTGKNDCVNLYYGSIKGNYAVAAFFNFQFMGGSMGREAGEYLIKAFQEAIDRNVPCVIFTASGGARMQEGILSLMQMARVTSMINQLKSKKLPYIVVHMNPTMGGVSASFAMIGDIHIAEQGAIIGFAGARVIEQTIKKTLPEGFQTAEYLVEHGMVDIVTHRKDLKDVLANTISLLYNKEV